MPWIDEGTLRIIGDTQASTKKEKYRGFGHDRFRDERSKSFSDTVVGADWGGADRGFRSLSVWPCPSLGGHVRRPLR